MYMDQVERRGGWEGGWRSNGGKGLLAAQGLG
jgi:hypothetical protein